MSTGDLVPNAPYRERYEWLGCAICGAPVPLTKKTREPRLICDRQQCRSALARWRRLRAADIQRAMREQHAGMRTCEHCGKTKPLDAEHFPRDRKHYRRLCRPCWNEHHRKSSHRYQEKVQADRALRAKIAEGARIARRLRAEQEGRTVVKRQPAVLNPYVEASGARSEHRDPRPLREWLNAVLADTDAKQLAHELGTDPRVFWRILHGEHKSVSLAVADTLLTRYGRPVVVRSRDLERRLIARARAMPGNGSRLLTYLDDAERLAPICDVALWRVEDLWPELEAA